MTSYITFCISDVKLWIFKKIKQTLSRLIYILKEQF